MAAASRRTPSMLALCDGAGVATPEAEYQLFTALRLPNGTRKTTFRNRLDDVNDRALEWLPTDRSLSVLDVAISSGISTVEWSDHMQGHGIDHKIVAGDLAVDACLTSFNGWLAVLFDNSGRHPLLLEVGAITVPVRSDHWLARAARPVLFPVLRLIAAVGRRLASSGPVGRGRWSHQAVALVTPELRRRPQIEVVQDDVTVPGRFPMSFDVIRVANLVQRVYFDDATLARIVFNLGERLRDNGILIMCRTMDDGVNHGTIFRRRGDRLVSEATINDGAEASDLVVAGRWPQ